MKQRIRATVRYDGTGFSGSQLQPGQRTVAGTLTDCLESLLEQQLHLLWAGRTDAGVHADGNVCAFDAELRFPAGKLAELANAWLPDDLQIRDCAGVAPGFHPRFDAVRRVYRYRIYRGADMPVDRYRYCHHYPGGWDEQVVADTLDRLAGSHSFHNYSLGVADPADALCSLEPVLQEQSGPELSWVFSGNRFLRHMVCRLAGVLLAVAGGQATPGQVAAGLERELDFRYVPAPAKGLTLIRVDYMDLTDRNQESS